MKEQADEMPGSGDELDPDGFQAVRRELFARTTQPAVSLNDCKTLCGSACLARSPDTNYGQILIDRRARIMVPVSAEGGAGAFRVARSVRG